MRVAGLTGGIASGKSTVTQLLRGEGITVIDCDQIAHDVVKKGRWGWWRLVAAFGQDILLPSGEVDREKLGRLVFQDPAARRRLNAATHLPVALALAWQLLWNWLMHEWLVVLDMPLLFETGTYRWTSPNVVVACGPQTQLERLLARDRGLSHEDAARRIAAQMDPAERRRRADVEISNDGAVQQLAPQVRQLAARLKHRSRLWGLITSPLAVGAVLLLVARRL